MGAALGPLLGMAQEQPQPQQPMVAPQPAQRSPFDFSGQQAPSPQSFSQSVQQAAPSDKKGPSLLDILSMMGGK